MLSSLKKKLSLLMFAFLPALPIDFAHGIALPQLSQDNLDSIERDMSADTNLHDALPPSSMGSIFGFEVGVIAGIAKSPGLNEQVKKVSTTDAGAIPHAGVVAAITVPFGITIEALYLPKMTMGDFTYQQYAGALKWTFTDGWMIPVNIAARGFMAKSTLNFDQTVSGTPTTMSNDTSVQGLQLLASPKLIPIIEPYVGVGQLTATGTLSSSAPVPIFSFTNASSASSSLGTTQLLAGLDIHALFFGLGLEWSRAFNTDSYTAKLSVKF